MFCNTQKGKRPTLCSKREAHRETVQSQCRIGRKLPLRKDKSLHFNFLPDIILTHEILQPQKTASVCRRRDHRLSPIAKCRSGEFFHEAVPVAPSEGNTLYYPDRKFLYRPILRPEKNRPRRLVPSDRRQGAEPADPDL